jgi:DNA polymerase I
MKIIHTDQVTPKDIRSQWEKDQIYNGLDCCVTLEVLEATQPQLDKHTAATYEFSKALQGPILEMRLRGVLVDQARKAQVIDEYFESLDRLERQLDEIVLNGVGMPTFNWRSNDNLKELFYDRLQIPPIRSKGRTSVDVNALERLDAYVIARSIVRHILAMREIGKKISVLKTATDPDGRIRTSYNIAGTNTGRFSSSFSEFGTGGNLQNVEESLRSIFIADPGMKFAKFDAKSGESFVVGAIEWNLFNDARYLEACESGDPHTAVARICWPNLGWSGDLGHDKGIAEQPYYRHYSYRFMCKKLGHGSNYGGQPFTLAQQSRLPISVVQQFQPKYFSAFPAHQQWQSWVDDQLRRYGYLVSLTGRKRWFLGRRNDADTLRGAIAYDPQCSLADIVNRAMLNVWTSRDAILVMHDHDALTVMYPAEREDEIIPRILRQLEVPIKLERGRTLLIPYDCKVGWNKGEFHATKNPEGLRDYAGTDERKRNPEVHLLDRIVHRAYRKPRKSVTVP